MPEKYGFVNAQRSVGAFLRGRVRRALIRYEEDDQSDPPRGPHRQADAVENHPKDEICGPLRDYFPFGGIGPCDTALSKKDSRAGAGRAAWPDKTESGKGSADPPVYPGISAGNDGTRHDGTSHA